MPWIVFALIGCPPPDGDKDAGPKVDAGTGHDSAVRDSAVRDRPATDAGSALGATCAAPEDCASGSCLNLFNVGTGYCNKTCTGEADCNFNDGLQYSCLDWGCTRTCNSGASCGADGECVLGVQVGSDLLNVCFMMEGLHCESQADCASGVCSYFYTNAKLVTFCNATNPAGDIETGAPCDPALVQGSPCRSVADCATGQECGTNGYCYPTPAHACQAAIWACSSTGVCMGPCAADDDCPTDMRCGKSSFQANNGTADDPLDDVFASYGYCFPLGGSRSSCVDDGECTVADESCIAYESAAGTYQQVCRTDPSNGQPAGSVCADLWGTDAVEPGAICDSGVCFLGTCSSVCSTAADCVGAPDAQCLLYQLNGYGDNAKLCVQGKACATDADCTSPTPCQPIGHQGGVAPGCMQLGGSVAYGGACDAFARLKEERTCYAEADCTGFGSGWTCDDGHHCKAPRDVKCATWDGCLATGKCTTLCTQDADCAISGTAMHCAGLHIAVDTKGTPDPADDTDALVKECQPNTTTETVCTKNADCASGQICAMSLALDGSLTWKCTVELAGGADVGASCGVVANAGVSCKTYFCDLENGDGLTDKGACTSRCIENADCPSPLTCQDFKPWEHLATTFKVCRSVGAGVP